MQQIQYELEIILQRKNVEVEIPVSFENMEEFIAFQFDLLIPEGLEFVSNSIVNENARFEDHNIAVNLINGSILRFIGYSPSNKSFLGNSGELFRFKLKSTVNAGYFPLDISNAVITNSTQESSSARNKIKENDNHFAKTNFHFMKL